MRGLVCCLSDQADLPSASVPVSTHSPKKAAKDLPKKADAAPAAPTAADAADKTKLSKNQLKKQAKKEKAAAVPAAAEPSKTAPGAAPAASAAKADEAVKPAKKAPNKKQTLPSGLVIEDNKVGTGPAAKAGQRVQMRYIGRLQKYVWTHCAHSSTGLIAHHSKYRADTALCLPITQPAAVRSSIKTPRAHPLHSSLASRKSSKGERRSSHSFSVLRRCVSLKDVD